MENNLGLSPVVNNEGLAARNYNSKIKMKTSLFLETIFSCYITFFCYFINSFMALMAVWLYQ